MIIYYLIYCSMHIIIKINICDHPKSKIYNVKVNGEIINSIKYIGDIVQIADTNSTGWTCLATGAKV